LVTGEAVALDLRVARFPSRAVALALDITLQLFAIGVIGVAVGRAADGMDEALTRAVALVSVVAVIVGYPALMETLTRGRTLGKMALGLRVVRDDGGPTRFRHSLVRALCAFFVDIWLTLGVVGLVTSLASQRGKRVGDHLAGTVVVHERVPVSAAAVTTTVWMPPFLSAWAATTDLSRVPDDLALAARSFLTRASALDPGTRLALAADLATRIGAHVAPMSPPGTPAEAYLAAVVAERSRRSTAGGPPLPRPPRPPGPPPGERLPGPPPPPSWSAGAPPPPGPLAPPAPAPPVPARRDEPPPEQAAGGFVLPR
jgi:uncharacterized RDD family membrane protein YckC